MISLLAESDAALADSFSQRAVSLSDEAQHGDVQGMHHVMCPKCGQQCQDDAISIQRHGFRIGSLGFLFPEKCPGEIVIDPEICPIPHTRKWMVGVMTLRSNLIPVFDLHSLLLDAPVDVHKPMVLILDQGRQALGFMLKDPPQWLTGLIEVPVADVPIPDLFAAQVSKIYRQHETSWLAFNKTDFFTFLAESAKSC